MKWQCAFQVHSVSGNCNNSAHVLAKIFFGLKIMYIIKKHTFCTVAQYYELGFKGEKHNINRIGSQILNEIVNL